MPVSSWDPIAANNNSAPPNGAPEGQAPSTVNDVLRQIMADVRVFYDDTALLSDSNVFTAAYSAGNPQIRISAAVPMMQWYQSTGGADAKLWQAYAGANKLVIGTAEDDEATSVDGIVLTRSGNTITDINLTATAARVNAESLFRGGYAVKTSDTSRNTTTTNSDDPHLQVVIPASGTFKFTLQLFVQNSTTATQGFKFTLATTGTITSTINDAIFSAFGGGSGGVSTAYGSTSPLNQGFANAVIDFATYTGVMVLTGAQTLKVQWAQNSSSANNTTLKAGSSLILQRLA